MKLQFYTNIFNFLETAGPFLESHETENGLMLGLTLRAQKRIQEGGESPIEMLTVFWGNDLIAASMRTPPHNLVLSRMPQEVVSFLANQLHEEGWDLPGAMGPDPVSQQFAEIWTQKTGLQSWVGVQQMIYQLDKVRDIPQAPGSFAQAVEADLDRVAQFFMAFQDEALYAAQKSPKEEHLQKALYRIQQGHLFLWRDQGEIVSMAGVSAPTRHGIRVNAVYTPPEHRGKGYASSNVAAVSQHQLDQGYSFCFLYTDASNPTSNKIYQRIGYEWVCNSALYRFGPK